MQFYQNKLGIFRKTSYKIKENLVVETFFYDFKNIIRKILNKKCQISKFFLYLIHISKSSFKNFTGRIFKESK